MRNVPKILGIMTMVLLLLVAAQGEWHFIHVRPLKGAFVMDPNPQPTLKAVMDGSWQMQTEKYIKGSFGFREPAIRLYNQYVYSCYGKSMNKGVIVGRDGYIYERYFVEDYYESRMYKYTEDPEELRHKFEMEARRLAKLQ